MLTFYKTFPKVTTPKSTESTNSTMPADPLVFYHGRGDFVNLLRR